MDNLVTAAMWVTNLSCCWILLHSSQIVFYSSQIRGVDQLCLQLKKFESTFLG